MLRPILRNAHDIRRQVLSIRIHGHNALILREMLRNIRIRRFERAPLAAVFRMAQERDLRRQSSEHGLRRLGASVIHHNDCIIRILPQRRNDAEQFFIRLIGRYHNDHIPFALLVQTCAAHRQGQAHICIILPHSPLHEKHFYPLFLQILHAINPGHFGAPD